MLVDIQWRSAVGFEGLYSVSSDGRVRRDAPTRGFGGRALPGRIMRQKTCADGYLSVSLYPASGKQKQINVHTLVARAFIGERGRLVVNHLNGDKADNRLENLEYITPSENIRHAYSTGLAKGQKGESNPMAKLNRDTAEAIRTLHGIGWSKSRLARAFRVDTSRIHRIINNKIWIAGQALT